MATRATQILQTGVITLALCSGQALADSTQASCDFYHKGDKKHEASGPCLFSQRQGYIDIRLKNGKEWSLSPQSKADHYKDQQGHKVKRRNENGVQVYKWDQRAIHVHFSGD